MPSKLLIAAVAALFTLAPGQDAGELGVDVRVDPRGVVVPLNRHIFDGNVVSGELSDHWIVRFCVDWYSPCQGIQRPYAALGSRYDATLNNDTLLSSVVRFAEVDCATDKWLCNEQHVDDYPTVAHYRGGEIVAQWTGDGGSLTQEVKSLSAWMANELRRARDGRSKAAPGSASTPGDRTFFRDAARVTAMVFPLVAMFVWVMHSGAEAWQAWGRLRSPAATGKPSKPPGAAEPGAAGRMSRILPREWKAERGSVVL